MHSEFLDNEGVCVCVCVCVWCCPWNLSGSGHATGATGQVE